MNNEKSHNKFPSLGFAKFKIHQDDNGNIIDYQLVTADDNFVVIAGCSQNEQEEKYLQQINRWLHKENHADLIRNFNDTLINNKINQFIIIPEGTNQEYKVTTFTESSIYITALFESTSVQHSPDSSFEEPNKQLYYNMPLAYQSLDSNGMLLDVNPQWLKTLGYSRDEVIGKWFGDYIPKEFQAHFKENFAKIKKQGAISGVELQILKKDQSTLDVSFVGTIEKDQKGEFLRSHGVFIDISIQKRIENDLKFQTQRLSMALNASQTGVWDWYFKEKRIDLDEQSYRMAGYKPNDFPNLLKEFRKRIHPDDQLRVENEILKHINGKRKYFDIEYRIASKDKHWMWIRTQGKITEKDEYGNPTHLSGTNTNVDSKKVAEIKLKESEKRFKTMFEELGDAIFITDFDGNIIQANPAAAKQTGYSLRQIKQINMVSALNVDHAVAHQVETINKLKKGGSVYFEEKKRRKNGEEYWTDCTLSLINLEGKDLVLSINRDITERKNAEEKIKQLSHVVEQNPATIVITNLKGEIEYVNQTFCQLTGYTFEEVIGKNPNVLKSGKTSQRVYKELWNTISGGKTWRGELLNRKKDGDLFWEDTSISPLKNETGEITHFVGVKENITDRKRNEILHEIELNIGKAIILTQDDESLFKVIRDELEKVTDSRNLVIGLYDKENEMVRSIYWSDRFDHFAEWPVKNTLSGRVLLNESPLFLTKNDIDAYYRKLGAEPTGKTAEFWIGVPLVIHNKTVGILIVQNYESSKPLDQYTEEVIILVANMVSIYLAKKWNEQELIDAKEKAEESEAQLKESQRVARIGYYIFNIREGLWTSSEMLDEIFGIDESYQRDVAGWLKLIHPDFQMDMQKYLQENILRDHETFDRQYKVVNQKNQSEHWVHGLGDLRYNKKGEITAMFGTIQDISNIKQYENELILAKEKAEESDHLKTAFLANMSHEIRTPMNGIMGFIDVLQHMDVTEHQREYYFDIVNKSGQRLMNTVNDIIEMSRLDSDQVQAKYEPVNLSKFLDELYVFFKPQVQEKKLKFLLSVDTDLENIVSYTDENKLGIIISNLLRNAIKFTHKGSIELGMKKDKEIIFYIKDTGIGIPDESIVSIFDRFVQADNRIERGYEGSGLGLSISKGYAEILGGTIWCDSTLGEGTTFYLSLPVNKDEK